MILPETLPAQFALPPISMLALDGGELFTDNASGRIGL